MARIALLPVVLLTAMSACKEDAEETVAPLGDVAGCGMPGARLEAEFLGGSFCANVALFGAEGAGTITINGIALAGNTLTLELDSLHPGSYATTETVNHVLYTTQLGLAFESSDATPATLIIASHDTGANRIQGSISGPLVNPLGGAPATIAASFDVTYVE